MKINSKNKNFIVSLIIIILAAVAIFGYKFSVSSNAILGFKEYKVIITDTDDTFEDEFDFKTKETSLGKDLDERGFIETEKGAYGRFVTGVNGKKADESKQQWWNLVVNGENSSTGIDEVMINDGDEIEFILTTGW